MLRLPAYAIGAGVIALVLSTVPVRADVAPHGGEIQTFQDKEEPKPDIAGERKAVVDKA